MKNKQSRKRQGLYDQQGKPQKKKKRKGRKKKIIV